VPALWLNTVLGSEIVAPGIFDSGSTLLKHAVRPISYKEFSRGGNALFLE
jgi:hypothetical protein